MVDYNGTFTKLGFACYPSLTVRPSPLVTKSRRTPGGGFVRDSGEVPHWGAGAKPR